MILGADRGRRDLGLDWTGNDVDSALVAVSADGLRYDFNRHAGRPRRGTPLIAGLA